MKINWHPNAKKDLHRFNEETQKRIVSHISTLETSPLGEHTSLFNKQGLEIFRLKLKNNRLDHRVFFDLNTNQVVILGVEHRDNAYTQDSIQKIKSRT